MVVIFVKIVKKIIERKQAEMQKVYPGLKCFKEGVRQIPIENIPGVVERGWKPDPEKRSVTGRGWGNGGCQFVNRYCGITKSDRHIKIAIEIYMYEILQGIHA